MRPKSAFILIATLLFCFVPASGQRTKEVKKSIDLNADGRLYIDTYKGSITVETWDKPNVELTALVEPDGPGRDAERDVQETEIRVDGNHDHVRIESDYDRLKRRHEHSFLGLFGDGNLTLPFVHYTITMPKTAKLEIKDYKSDSRITNLHAALRLETYKGSVVVTGLEGEVNLETYKGEVRVDLEKLAGDSRLETSKGKIEIGFAARAGCDIEVDLGRRADFQSDFETLVRSSRRESQRFHASINGGGPTLRVETEKGEIRLRKR